MQRRHDIDWLRVLAVLLLVPYHSAVIFARPYVSYIKVEPNAGLEAFAYFLNQWHMALLFLVSGVATWFSLSSRTWRQYLRERVNRLIVPLVFGTLAIVPIQVYFQRLHYGDFSGSFIRFYPHIFEGIYPHGNFTWGQLWFLAYLFVFSLIGVPLFLLLGKGKPRRVVEQAGAFCERPGALFLAAIPLMAAQAVLRAKWPGFQNLYDDWANFAFYFTVFVYGYLLCSDDGFGRAIDRHWRISLGLGIGAVSVILALRQTGSAPAPDYSPAWVFYMLLHGFSSWCWLVALLGLGRRYLTFSNRVLEYATEAVLPFYVIHHAVIVVIGYYVVRWNAGDMLKFTIITIASLVLATILYDVLIRRTYATRFLFGMKAQR